MGRVERRMYKQRRRRKWRLFLLVLLASAVVITLKLLPDGFISEYIPLTDARPQLSSFDQTVESREVTLSQETWYAIQTGVFSSEDAARQKADAYTSRGAPGTVVKDGEKWRVFIACYETESDAAAVRTRLETNQRVETYLYAWALPEVRLRLTGKAGQLDTAEAGFTLLISTANAIRDATIDLDAGQLTNDEAAEAIRALDEGVTLWEETVRSRFGKNPPQLLKGMLTIASNWDARREAILSTGNATDLSAALKAQAMGMYDEIRAWRNELLTQ